MKLDLVAGMANLKDHEPTPGTEQVRKPAYFMKKKRIFAIVHQLHEQLIPQHPELLRLWLTITEKHSLKDFAKSGSLLIESQDPIPFTLSHFSWWRKGAWNIEHHEESFLLALLDRSSIQESGIILLKRPGWIETKARIEIAIVFCIWPVGVFLHRYLRTVSLPSHRQPTCRNRS